MMTKRIRSYNEFLRRYLPKTWAKMQEAKPSDGERIAKKILEAREEATNA